MVGLVVSMSAQPAPEQYQDVVLVLDTSGSMKALIKEGGPNNGQRRIDVLRRALEGYINEIERDRAPVRLTLLNFDEGVKGADPNGLATRTFLLPQDAAKALSAVRDRTDEQNLGNYTHLYEAIEDALRVAELRAKQNPDSTVCVYICTDGAEDKRKELAETMRSSATALRDIINRLGDRGALTDGRIFATLALLGDDRIKNGPDKDKTVSQLVEPFRRQAGDLMAIYSDAGFSFLFPPTVYAREVESGVLSKRDANDGVRFYLSPVPTFGGKTGQVDWRLKAPGEKEFARVQGAGSNSQAKIPAGRFSKLWNYKVQAVASWENGRVRSQGLTAFEVVPDRLEVSLTAKPERVIEGDEVTFSIQVAGEAKLTKVVWDFGDGKVETDDASPPAKDRWHVYASEGRKEAKVTVTSADGGTAQGSTDVLVDTDEIDAFIAVLVNGKKSFDQASIPEKNSAFGRITAGQDVVLKPSRDRTADGVEYTWTGPDGARQTGASFRFQTTTPGTTDVTLQARRHSSEETASIKVTVRPRAPWWILAVTGGVGAMMLGYLTFLLTGNKMADWKLSVWSPSQKTIPAPKLLNDYWSRTGKVAVVPLSAFKRDPLLSTFKDSTQNLRCAQVPAWRNRLPGNVTYDDKRRDDGWITIDKECSAKRSELELALAPTRLNRSVDHRTAKEDGKRRIRLEYAEQSRLGEKALLALVWIGVIGANAAVFWWIAGH